MREIKRARERARERETERQRQRDREAETEKQRDVETDRQQDRPPPSVSVSVCRCVRSEVERLAARGEAAPVPVLLGTNRDEGTTFCHLVRRPPRACPPPRPHRSLTPSLDRSLPRSLWRGRGHGADADVVDGAGAVTGVGCWLQSRQANTSEYERYLDNLVGAVNAPHVLQA